MKATAWPGIPAAFPSPSPATSAPPSSGGGSPPAGWAIQHVMDWDVTVAQPNTLVLWDTTDALNLTLPAASALAGGVVVVAPTVADAEIIVGPASGDSLVWDMAGTRFTGLRGMGSASKAFYSDGVNTWYAVFG